MEYGPRALGNRSVLYPAKRSGGEPVAQPAARPHRVHAVRPGRPGRARRRGCSRTCRGCEKTAEFMTITFDCTDEMKRQCPAAVHVDGTARPQLVSERTNPSFHRILHGYYEPDRHPGGHQHQLQHARGADRLLARRTRSGRSCWATSTTSRSGRSWSRTRSCKRILNDGSGSVPSSHHAPRDEPPRLQHHARTDGNRGLGLITRSVMATFKKCVTDVPAGC